MRLLATCRDQAAWSKESNEGTPYLSLKIDDLSFAAPIFGDLFDDPDGGGYPLVCSRCRDHNGE
jgi:uncharacterized protein (DUF736 family)